LNPAELVRWNQQLAELKKRLIGEARELSFESRKESAKDVKDFQAINVSLLGIKFSSVDLDIFGAIALFFFSAYYLLCVRRMSLEMESMYVENTKLSPIQQRYVYHGIRQSYVLNTTGEVDGIGGRPSEVERLARSEPALHFARWLFPKVTFLPFLTVGLMIYSDWHFVFVSIRNTYGSSLRWWSHLVDEFRWQLQ
jgi:hypothetical protein